VESNEWKDLFATHCSQHIALFPPFHCSLLTTHCSLPPPPHCSLLPTLLSSSHSLLIAPYSLLSSPSHCSQTGPNFAEPIPSHPETATQVQAHNPSWEDTAPSPLTSPPVTLRRPYVRLIAPSAQRRPTLAARPWSAVFRCQLFA